MSPEPMSLEPPYGARDARDMAALVDAIPEHITVALARTAAAPWQLPIRTPVSSRSGAWEVPRSRQS